MVLIAMLVGCGTCPTSGTYVGSWEAGDGSMEGQMSLGMPASDEELGIVALYQGDGTTLVQGAPPGACDGGTFDIELRHVEPTAVDGPVWGSLTGSVAVDGTASGTWSFDVVVEEPEFAGLSGSWSAVVDAY